MRWLLKAAIQKTVSTLPRAEEINYWLQRRLSSSIPRDEDNFWFNVGLAARHWATYTAHRPAAAGAPKLYEFGAGWDLVGPLSLWCAGVSDQTLIDLRPLVRIELVNSTIERLRAQASRVQGSLEGSRDLPDVRLSSLDDLERVFGIRYLAPCDARATGLPVGSIDLITNTDTLEHIPPDDIGTILNECARLLSASGIASFIIDLNDHYSYVDDSISKLNFLRHGDRTWRWLNNELHFQNRLRCSDYQALFAASKLEVISEVSEPGSPEDYRSLEQMTLAPVFRGRSPADLSVHGMHIVARSP